MLYIVGTPIGNLGDITLRAIETLKSVSTIIAENPLHTGILLKRYEITGKKMIQLADHNEEQALPPLLKLLETEDVALVSDAGTPAISDPGFRLVRACVAANIAVTSIPGPSAVISTLAAGGLPTDKFTFIGFFAKTEPKVIRAIEEAKNCEATLVAYESPQRILKTVTLINKTFPEAHIVVARELTKLHEEFIRGTSAEVLELLKKKPTIKGEITLLVSFK